ncbi:MAG: hypothetical protein BAJATHORv1_20295 [Candidatus Thorarchaeota archaeon]|nr:MAG: hypothetical protein BAJATHORv1_20295 [Candidatus Thorarchaeota archaeon]
MPIPSISSHHFRDRDVFQDEMSRIYVTLGHIQPPDGIISVLKYLPDVTGQWESGNIRYRRIFSNDVVSSHTGMEILPNEYYDDTHFGTDILKFPVSKVVHYFKPEERLKQIINEGPNDELERIVSKLACSFHDILDIPFDQLGVTGSIAWNAHNPSFSDINMNIHGFDWSWYLEENYPRLVQEDSSLQLTEGALWANSVSRLRERIVCLGSDEILVLFKRRRQLQFHQQPITIMPVLNPSESPIEYGTEKYNSTFLVKAEVEITSSRYGIFFPALYEVVGTAESTRSSISVTRLMIYDGAFRGLFQDGDILQVHGTLQKVQRLDGSSFFQIMIGTLAGAGKEHIIITKPSQSYQEATR